MTELVKPGTYDITTLGLEDADTTVAIPRIKILHKDTLLELMGEKTSELNLVFLGQFQQRIMWEGSMEDTDAGPMCKSVDDKIGWPNVNPADPEYKRFPWQDSNFNEADADISDQNGLPMLSCAACKFKEWTSDPKRPGKNIKPRCGQQHTYAVAYQDGEDWMPATITFSGTGLKPSRDYAGTFRLAGKPMFSVVTVLSLQEEHRGDNTFSTPKFRRGESVPDEYWDDMAQRYFVMKEQILRVPRAIEGVSAVADNTNSAPAEVKQPEARPAAEAVAKPVETPAAQAAPVTAAKSSMFKPKTTEAKATTPSKTDEAKVTETSSVAVIHDAEVVPEDGVTEESEELPF